MNEDANTLYDKIKDNLPYNTDELKLIVARLTSDVLWYIEQYCPEAKETHNKDKYLLKHHCMSAGESLCETLELLGVAEDDGQSIEINPEIVKLLGLND